MFVRQFSKHIIKRPIVVSNNAWCKIKDIISSGKGYGMLFSVVSGGCNGFNYKLELLNNNNLPKKIYTYPFVSYNEDKIFIDPLSEIYLLGTTIDYHNQNYNKNIYESKFVFDRNSDDVASCGCGVSFVLKD